MVLERRGVTLYRTSNQLVEAEQKRMKENRALPSSVALAPLPTADPCLVGIWQHDPRRNGRPFLQEISTTAKTATSRNNLICWPTRLLGVDVSQHHVLGPTGTRPPATKPGRHLVGRHLLILRLLTLACCTWTEPRSP